MLTDVSHRPGGAARNWLLGALVCAAVLTLLAVAAPIAVPIFMAVFLAAVLRAPVRILMRSRVPQPVAAAVVFLAFALAMGALALSLYRPAADWVNEAPTLIARLEAKLVPIKETIKEAESAAKKIEEATDLSQPATPPVVVEETSRATSFIERAFDTSRVFLVQVAVTVILAFFMLVIRSPILPPALFDHFGARGPQMRASLREIETQMSRYMGAMAVINGSVGVLTALAMYAYGLPSPILWGALAAVLGFIPFLGPLVAVGLIASASFLTFESWPAILAPPLTYFAFHMIESEFVTPFFMGRMMRLHPVTIFIFVLIWGWMWGLAGAFLAVPILAALVITARNFFIDEGRTLSDLVFTPRTGRDGARRGA